MNKIQIHKPDFAQCGENYPKEGHSGNLGGFTALNKLDFSSWKFQGLGTKQTQGPGVYERKYGFREKTERYQIAC